LKVGEVREPEDDAIDVRTERSLVMRSTRSFTAIFQLGAAIARLGENETAYSHRSKNCNISINPIWVPDEPIGEAETEWACDLFEQLNAKRHACTSTS
jgi:hypothetical protein